MNRSLLFGGLALAAAFLTLAAPKSAAAQAEPSKSPVSATYTVAMSTGEVISTSTPVTIEVTEITPQCGISVCWQKVMTLSMDYSGQFTGTAIVPVTTTVIVKGVFVVESAGMPKYRLPVQFVFTPGMLVVIGKVSVYRPFNPAGEFWVSFKDAQCQSGKWVVQHGFRRWLPVFVNSGWVDNPPQP
jgi:hypothetical protein